MTDLKKRPRPKILPSKTVCIDTGCGSLYVTMTFLDGEIFEVFAHMDHADSCMKSQTEAVCRLISSGRRYGVPIEEFIKQLRNIRCGKRGPFSKEEPVWSCADGISLALRREMDE